MIGVGVSVSTIAILGGEVGSGLGVDASYLNVLQDLVLAGETVAVYDLSDATTINVARDGSGGNPGASDPAGMLIDNARWGGQSFDAVMAAQVELAGTDGWTPSAQSSVSNGVISRAVGGSGVALDELVGGVVAGRSYKVEVTNFTQVTAGSNTLQLRLKSSGGGSDWTIPLISGNAVVSDLIWTPATSGNIELRWFDANEDGACSFQISIKEIPSHIAVAPSDNGRATWNVDTDPTLYDVSGQAELVTNGGFDVDLTAWIANEGSDGSVVAGEMVIDATAGNRSYYQDVTGLTAGATYLLTLDKILVGSVFVYDGANFSTQLSGSPLSADGSIVVTPTGTTIRIRPFVASGNVGTFDGFSLKEIPASQLKHHLTLDGVDDGYDLGVTPADNMTLVLAMRTSDTQFVIGDDSGTAGRYMLAAVENSTDTTLNGQAGTPSYRLNGVAQSWVNRGAAHTAIATTDWVVLTITDADIATWNTLSLSRLAGWFLAGDIRRAGVFTGQTPEQLEAIEAEYGRAVGLTL